MPPDIVLPDAIAPDDIVPEELGPDADPGMARAVVPTSSATAAAAKVNRSM
jgi:hypothetical protein